MAILSLTGQTIASAEITPKLVQLKNLMDQRKIIWDKISDEKKRAWVLSEKDPIMDIAWDVFRYLNNNFFGDHKDD